MIPYMYDYNPTKHIANDGLARRKMKQDRQTLIYRELDQDIREALESLSTTEYLGETK